MGVFRWFSDEAVPPALDLRLLGWTLAGHDDPSECVAIVPAFALAHGDQASLPTSQPAVRRLTMVGGVDDPAERARLLNLGFGDAVGGEVTLVELHARAWRLPASRDWLPRRRVFARLELDLLTRDAISDGQPIGLKPKEFDLLWRLADTPDEAVSRQALIQDVMRLSFEPASNSIAVHMSRLRSKLGAAGLHDVVETAGGGYRLRVPPAGLQASWTAGLPSTGGADPRLS